MINQKTTQKNLTFFTCQGTEAQLTMTHPLVGIQYVPYIARAAVRSKYVDTLL